MHRFNNFWIEFFKIIAVFAVALGILSLCLFVITYLFCKDLDKGLLPNNATTKTLKIAYSQNVGALNPQGYGKNAMFAQNLVFEGLVRLNKNGEIVPSLASAWSVDKEGKIYTFSLRKGVRFSNGEEFNADAVVLNFKSILQNRIRHSWSGLVGVIKSVEKVDDYAVRIILKSPYTPTLRELALVRPFRFLAPSAFPPDLDLVKHNPVSIGTGAYMLAESKAGAFDKFVKNPHYWVNASNSAEEAQNQASENQQGKFYYDEVLIKVIFEPNSKLAALKAGQVDMIYGADEIPTRIFMEVAEAGGGFCTNAFFCHTERSEVSKRVVSLEKNNRDISPTAQYDNVEVICNDKNGEQNPPKNPEFKAYLGKEAFVTSLLLNSTRLREAGVREAIALAIDKEAAINAVYGELASIAESIFVGEDSHLSLRGDTICHTEVLQKTEVSQHDYGRDSSLATQAKNDKLRDISVSTKPQYDKKNSPSRSTSGVSGWVNPSTNTLNSESTSQNLAQPHETNLQKAREILAMLGYTEANPLRVTLLFLSDKPNQKMLSQILQTQLKRANIALSLRGLDPSMFYNALKNGEFEIAFSKSWGAPYEPLSQLYSFTKPLGHGDYLAQSALRNKVEIDAIILSAINAPNEKEARKDASEAIALLLDSRVYIPLVIERNKAIANGRIKGVERVSGVSYEIPVWEFYE